MWVPPEVTERSAFRRSNAWPVATWDHPRPQRRTEEISRAVRQQRKRHVVEIGLLLLKSERRYHKSESRRHAHEKLAPAVAALFPEYSRIIAERLHFRHDDLLGVGMLGIDQKCKRGPTITNQWEWQRGSQYAYLRSLVLRSDLPFREIVILAPKCHVLCVWHVRNVE